MNGKNKDKFIQPQDTIPVLKQDTLIKIDSVPASSLVRKDTSSTDSIQKTTKKYSLEEADSILIKNEQRLKKIEYARAVKAKEQKLIALKKLEVEQQKSDFELNNIIFSFDSLNNWPNPYFLDNIQFDPIDKASLQSDFYIYEDLGSTKDTTERTSTQPDKSFISRFNSNSVEKAGHAWFLIIFILVLAQLARVRLYYGKFFGPVLFSSISYQTENNLYRNRNTQFFQYSFNLNTIFFLIVPLFIIQVSESFHINILKYSSVVNYLVLVAVVFAWFILKYIVSKLIGYISLSQKLFDEYFFTYSLSIKNIALLLIPVSIFIAYVDIGFNHVFIFLGIAIMGLAYILRVSRLLFLFLSKRFSVLYGILYLCALEILPILILIRIFVPL